MMTSRDKIRQTLMATLAFAVTLPSLPAHAQNRERQELLERISHDIRIAPEAACAYPQREIEEFLSQQVNQHGLMDNISRTVFNRVAGDNTNLSALDASMAAIRAETARRFARSQAIYNGEEVPVGDQPLPDEPAYDARLNNVRATTRIENGLECAAQAQAEPLRFPISYTVVLDPDQADGWAARWLGLPLFDESSALADSSPLRIAYAETELPLAQAREQGRLDRARHTAAADEEQRRDAAQEAFINSPAGRAAALQQRREMVAQQRACEANGGTWGVRSDNVIIRVDASQTGGLGAALQGCYFLGR